MILFIGVAMSGKSKINEVSGGSGSRTMEFYRSSAAGIALIKALNTMLEEGDMVMEDAVQILEEFDAAFVNSMRESYATHKRLELMEANVCNFLVYKTFFLFLNYFA